MSICIPVKMCFLFRCCSSSESELLLPSFPNSFLLIDATREFLFLFAGAAFFFRIPITKCLKCYPVTMTGQVLLQCIVRHRFDHISVDLKPEKSFVQDFIGKGQLYFISYTCICMKYLRMRKAKISLPGIKVAGSSPLCVTIFLPAMFACFIRLYRWRPILNQNEWSVSILVWDKILIFG